MDLIEKKNHTEVEPGDKRESWAEVNLELSEPRSVAAVARSLSQLPAPTSQ